MQKLFRDQRAGSNALTFLILFIVIVVMLISFIEPVLLSYSDIMLFLGYKKGLDAVQQSGGLTSEIEDSIKSYLSSFGLDQTKVQIDGTIAPVEWGKDVALRIRYTNEYKLYTVKGVVIESETKTMQRQLEGSTTSYFSEDKI